MLPICNATTSHKGWAKALWRRRCDATIRNDSEKIGVGHGYASTFARAACTIACCSAARPTSACFAHSATSIASDPSTVAGEGRASSVPETPAAPGRSWRTSAIARNRAVHPSAIDSTPSRIPATTRLGVDRRDRISPITAARLARKAVVCPISTLTGCVRSPISRTTSACMAWTAISRRSPDFSSEAGPFSTRWKDAV